MASVAVLPSPLTTTVAAIGPSGITMRTVDIAPPVPATAAEAFFPSFQNALSLAACIGQLATSRVLKTLEEHITMPDQVTRNHMAWSSRNK